MPLRLFAVLALASLAHAQVTLIDNDGKPQKGRDVLVSPSGEVSLLHDSGAPTKLKLDAVAEITFDRALDKSSAYEVQLNNANPRYRDILTGAIGAAPDDKSLSLTGTDAADLTVPLDFINSIRAAKSSFQFPDEPGERHKDVVHFRRDKAADRDKGTILAISKDQVELHSDLFEDQRNYKWTEIDGVLLADYDPKPLPQGVIVTIATRRGIRVTGRLLELTDKICRVETSFQHAGKPWTLDIAASSVTSIQVMNGNLVYVSDMTLKLVDESHRHLGSNPEREKLERWYFLDEQVRTLAYEGAPGPISIRGKRYRKGISTRMRVSLEVPLDAEYGRFSASVGVLDMAEPTGDAAPELTFTVLGDGKQLWKSKVMTFDDPAEPVALDVKGVKTLTLVSDYETDIESLSWGAWADARVVK